MVSSAVGYLVLADTRRDAGRKRKDFYVAVVMWMLNPMLGNGTVW